MSTTMEEITILPLPEPTTGFYVAADLYASPIPYFVAGLEEDQYGDIEDELMKVFDERSMDRSMDVFGDVLDEVALEGLDGITLQGLWERLKVRPGFTMEMSEESKAYIWKNVKILKGIQVFLLPTARADLFVYNRYDYKDDRENVIEPPSLKNDIYVYCPVDDKKTRIRGSCLLYSQRKEATTEVRNMRYKSVHEKYGNRLILVASQYHRESAIFPTEIQSDIELTIIQYCIVERVARARYPGEGTRGKVSLSVMKIDPKSLFYQRKLLLKKTIITKQSFSMKFGESRITSLISILHIPRFFSPVETIMNKNIKKIFQHLLQMPGFRDECAKLKHTYGKHTIRNILLPEFGDIFFQTDISYADLHVELMNKEKNLVKLESYRRKFVRVIAIKNQYINIDTFFRLKVEEKEEVDPESVVPEKHYFSGDGLCSQLTLNYRAHRHVIKSGPKGATLREMAEEENISNLDARTMCRFLARLKFVSTVLEDMKKTKVNRYVWFRYKNANKIYQQLGSRTEPEPVIPIDALSLPPPQEELTYWSMVDGSAEPQLMTLNGDKVFPVPNAADIITKTSIGIVSPKKREVNKVISPSSSISSMDDVMTSASTETVEMDVEVASTSSQDSVDGLLNSMEISFLAPLDLVETELEEGPENDFNFPDFCDHNLHFSKGEANDFVCIEGRDKISFTFESYGGWQVLLEPADVRLSVGRNSSTYLSVKGMDRANFLLDMIYKQTLVLGFQQILRGVRKHELAAFNQKEEADRRSLYRILKQLQLENRILMWKVSVTNGIHRRVCSAFTPGDITESNPLLIRAVDSLVQSVIRRTKLTKDQKRQRQKKINILKKASAGPAEPKDKPRVKSKPGPKKKRAIHLVKPRAQKSQPKFIISDFNTYTREKYKRKPDNVDKEAIARMSGQREDWTPQEDRYALCLFISSILFIPRYNLDKVFIFNAPQIRDILHTKLPVSQCKTSSSLRRRLHFLMKNKNYYSRYQYYLSTALDDHELRSEILTQYNPNGLSAKIFYEIPTDALTKVFEYLLNVFSNTATLYRFEDDMTSGPSGTEDQDKECSDEEDEEENPPETLKAAECDDDDEEEESSDSDEFYEDTDEDISDPSPSTVIKPLKKLSPEDLLGVIIETTIEQEALIVDGSDDPPDDITIEIWTARTSLLSLILSGETMSDVTAFLDCVSDEVLEYVVQNLRSLTITTIAKPNNRFIISTIMKRKLQTHIIPPVYRQCYDVLRELRSGIKFECTPEMCIPALFLLPDFTTKRAMTFDIEIAERVITVNEQWQDVFAQFVDKDFELTPPKKKTPPPKKVFREELDKRGGKKRRNKRKLQSEFNADSKKRRRLDLLNDEIQIDDDDEIFENLNDIHGRVKMEGHERVQKIPDPNPLCDVPEDIQTQIRNLVQYKRKNISDEALARYNEIFSAKAARVRDDDEDSTNSGSFRTLVIRSDSVSSQDLGSDDSDYEGADDGDGIPSSSRALKMSLERAARFCCTQTTKYSKSSSDSELHQGDSESESGSNTRNDFDDDGEYDLIDLDEDDTLSYAIRGRDEMDSDTEDDEQSKMKNAKVADSLRKALMKLPKSKRTGIGNEEACMAKGRISNKTLRSLRAKINATRAESKLIEKDFFSVNIPKVYVDFLGRIDDALYNGPRPMSDDIFLQNLLIKTVPSNCFKISPDPNHMGRYVTMYEIIELTEEVGISIPYLLTKFDRESVSEGLHFLLNYNYVYMVGVRYRRFVASCHSNKWTMPVPKTRGGVFTERLIMRPWITSFGSLNWPMLIQVFSSLIGYLSTNPSIRVKTLCELLNPILSYVETMVLLEAMVHMEFIKLYAVDVTHNVSMFSTPTSVRKNAQIYHFLDMEFLWVELRSFVTAKFADLQDSIHPPTTSEHSFPDVLAD